MDSRSKAGKQAKASAAHAAAAAAEAEAKDAQLNLRWKLAHAASPLSQSLCRSYNHQLLSAAARDKIVLSDGVKQRFCAGCCV